MATIKLTTWERIVIATNLIGAMQVSDPRTMRKASKILDAVELSEEERETIHLVMDVNGVAYWDDSDKIESQLWEINLGPDELALLKQQAQTPPAPWRGGQSRWVLHLYDTLGIE